MVRGIRESDGFISDETLQHHNTDNTCTQERQSFSCLGTKFISLLLFPQHFYLWKLELGYSVYGILFNLFNLRMRIFFLSFAIGNLFICISFGQSFFMRLTRESNLCFHLQLRASITKKASAELALI